MKWRLLLFCLFVLKGVEAQTLQLRLSHAVKGVPMVLGNTTYLNAAGDTFNITLFKYYLSNFSLTDTTGRIVRTASGCFLVSEDSVASKMISLKLPEGHYNSISFQIGVDSLLNCSGAQSGALDPLYGMFWTWNSGYIMAKLEGASPSSQLPGHRIEFHIGGYRAPHITQRMVTLPLPQTLVISGSGASNLSLVGDAYSWFQGISFRQLAGFMTPGTPADRIADNYQHMFSIHQK
ncbi:hypothetical protein SAMN05518672_104535 [Chitinophaga sp. CF118]|uniref:MbnP family protein n=1 Tax=Chitinophaga sp. CF118 TaxID=1884367 RepID=UPI0008F03155|nr:MbnP family protein [Chitinophaga sp. CF118]SFE11390.1 hypothetical protein SAMN05518672_104535 [Chitinophaga sp. CF118]